MVPSTNFNQILEETSSKNRKIDELITKDKENARWIEELEIQIQKQKGLIQQQEEKIEEQEGKIEDQEGHIKKTIEDKEEQNRMIEN